MSTPATSPDLFGGAVKARRGRWRWRPTELHEADIGKLVSGRIARQAVPTREQPPPPRIWVLDDRAGAVLSVPADAWRRFTGSLKWHDHRRGNGAPRLLG